jgi:hypothetical protein
MGKLSGVHRLWVRYGFEFVNFVAMTVVGIVLLLSTVRNGLDWWVVGGSLFMISVGSWSLTRMYRGLPDETETP